jgi:hypothetical protein
MNSFGDRIILTPYRTKILNQLLKVILLFSGAICVIFAFWYHQEFYRHGLSVLLVIGGIALTSFFILVGLGTSSRNLFGSQYKLTLMFNAQDKYQLLRDGKTSCIFTAIPYQAVRIGDVFDAVVAGHSEHERFAKLKVTDNYRVRLGELLERASNGTDDEYSLQKLAQFRADWEQAVGTWEPERFVQVLEFKVIG